MHTDPSIRRITVEIPAECPIRADDLEWAFAGLEPCDPQTGTARSSRITSTDDSRMADRFMRRARAFRSITAVVLPSAPRRRIGTDGLAKKPAAERHREEALAAGAVVHALRHAGVRAKPIGIRVRREPFHHRAKKPAAERHREEALAAGAVVHALRHAGVRAKPIGIRVRREPFHHRGVRAERFAEGSRFSKHALWHVELRFAEAIAGPLVIGDGRFCGLGLMVPVTEHADVVAFKLETPNRIAADDCVLLVRALRRALMAIARNDVGSVDRLFSGHEPDGGADRSGHHAHVFLAADGGGGNDECIMRLIAAAPWVLTGQ